MAKKATNTKAKADSKAQNNNAKPEDKALEPSGGLTNAQMIAALDAIGVKPPSKAVKADLEKLMEENKASLELMARTAENKKACLIKSFGAHGSSSLCAKCKKKQEGVYNDCAEFMRLLGVKKAASKKTRKMGHRTGGSIFGTRKKTMANRFCKALLDAGDAGLSMTEAVKAKWNPKSYRFNETADRLLKEKLVELREGRYYVTELGYEQSGRRSTNAA